MEKLVDRHTRVGVLKEHPLHQNQYAYQIGKSTETAIHNVVTRTDSTIKYKEITTGAFLDIEGVFDRTSFYVLPQAAESMALSPLFAGGSVLHLKPEK
jgi:hypothetical protein